MKPLRIFVPPRLVSKLHRELNGLHLEDVQIELFEDSDKPTLTVTFNTTTAVSAVSKALVDFSKQHYSILYMLIFYINASIAP